MKKLYEIPGMDILIFPAKDVIATSLVNGGQNGNDITNSFEEIMNSSN